MLGHAIRFLVAAAALGSGAGAIGLTPAQPAGATRGAAADIPFDFRTRQPIVPVALNGGVAVPFVVDTGASIHIVDREVARLAKLGDGRDVPMRGGGEGTVATQWVGNVTFAFGGRSWPAQRAALAPLGYPDRKHFAGLIGAPILMQYAVRFDFPAQRLQLLDPATYEPPAGALRVPFELQDDLPVVRVTVDAGGGPVIARLMVDTGASTSIDLNRPFVDRHGLAHALPEATAADRPAAIGGTAPFLYATGRRAAIDGESLDAAGRRTAGSVVFDRPRLGLSRAQTGSSASDARDGIIGNELLRRYLMTIDYRRRTLVLAVSERPRSPRNRLSHRRTRRHVPRASMRRLTRSGQRGVRIRHAGH